MRLHSYNSSRGATNTFTLIYCSQNRMPIVDKTFPMQILFGTILYRCVLGQFLYQLRTLIVIFEKNIHVSVSTFLLGPLDTSVLGPMCPECLRSEVSGTQLNMFT